MKGYAYTFYNDKVKVFKGDIFVPPNGKMLFISNKTHNYLMSLNEGEIIDDCLWLFKRDDQKAIDLFIKHHELLLSDLQNRINKLNSLKNAKINIEEGD